MKTFEIWCKSKLVSGDWWRVAVFETTSIFPATYAVSGMQEVWTNHEFDIRPVVR